jgi:hypothetical protein
MPRNGGTQVRLALLLVEGDTAISSRYHRTSIPAGLAAELQMAEVNSHLESMGEALVSDEDIQRIATFHETVKLLSPQ